MEQMKNKNEFRDGDKLYIQQMDNCIVSRRVNDTYDLRCKIHQRGENFYKYTMGNKYIENSYGTKKLWLLDDALNIVKSSVNRFKVEAAALTKKNKVSLDIIGLDVYYSIFSKGDFLLKFDDINKDHVFEIYRDKDFADIFFEITFCNSRFKNHKEAEELFKILQDSTNETIEKNPFYIEAVKQGDVHAQIEMKMHYHIASEEDCVRLSEILNQRILPPLSEEYNKNYVIDANTVNSKVYKLLKLSGYTILHRPYFGMKGCTRKKIGLNPHTKYGVDAAKADDTSIPFSEYLDMFNESK